MDYIEQIQLFILLKSELDESLFFYKSRYRSKWYCRIIFLYKNY